MPERLILPRVQDVLQGARRLYSFQDDLKALAEREGWMPEKEADLHKWELVGADLADAFCHFPVDRDELSNCICPGLEPGQFILYTALLFGFKAVPLLMARLAAMFTRFLQSLLAKGKGVIQTYMDDPLILLAGTDARRNRTLALLLYSMWALGINIAYHKGERGLRVTWIGVVFELDLEREVLKLTVSRKMANEFHEKLKSWETGMISRKTQLVGRDPSKMQMGRFHSLRRGGSSRERRKRRNGGSEGGQQAIGSEAKALPGPRRPGQVATPMARDVPGAGRAVYAAYRGVLPHAPGLGHHHGRFSPRCRSNPLLRQLGPWGTHPMGSNGSPSAQGRHRLAGAGVW